MRKIIAILLMLTVAISFAACGDMNPDGSSSTAGSTTTESGKKPAGDTSLPTGNSADTAGNDSDKGTEPTDKDKKVLIAYFSATKTTKKVAEHAADVMNADIYEIVPAVPYTSEDLNYSNNSCRANTEMSDLSCRPAINGSVNDMTDYDIVFIGYPIWFGEAPRIVSTFVESYDFSGKTVVTFCTSGSSPNNDRTIKALVSGADWVSGIRLSGSASKSDVSDWINALNLD